jgi:hypothetical protein
VATKEDEVQIFRDSYSKQDPLRYPFFISVENVCKPRTKKKTTHLKIPADSLDESHGKPAYRQLLFK